MSLRLGVIPHSGPFLLDTLFVRGEFRIIVRSRSGGPHGKIPQRHPPGRSMHRHQRFVEFQQRAARQLQFMLIGLIHRANRLVEKRCT